MFELDKQQFGAFVADQRRQDVYKRQMPTGSFYSHLSILIIRIVSNGLKRR